MVTNERIRCFYAQVPKQGRVVRPSVSVGICRNTGGQLDPDPAQRLDLSALNFLNFDPKIKSWQIGLALSARMQ